MAFSRFLMRSWRTNPALTGVSLAMLILLPGFVIGLIIDPRVITGSPAWLKPSKFAVSIVIYCFSFIWLMSYVQGHTRLVRWLMNGTAIIFLVEMAVIVIQVLRGTSSHFNTTTALNSILFSIMGSMISFLFILAMIAAGLLLRQGFTNPAFAWSLRWGLLISLLGMALAFLMTVPTSTQLAALSANQQMPISGAHSVGVVDGGPGLPIVGWSTTGGDLRVAHFVGLHAMQLLPLIGWFVSRWRLSLRQQLRVIHGSAISYLGLVILLTWQALRAQSVFAPDMLTLLGYVLIGTIMLVTLLISWPRQLTSVIANSQQLPRL